MSKCPDPIDLEADKQDHDVAQKFLDGMTERVGWIVYYAMWAAGKRIERAPHEIARLTPRKKP